VVDETADIELGQMHAGELIRSLIGEPSGLLARINSFCSRGRVHVSGRGFAVPDKVEASGARSSIRSEQRTHNPFHSRHRENLGNIEGFAFRPIRPIRGVIRSRIAKTLWPGRVPTRLKAGAGRTAHRGGIWLMGVHASPTMESVRGFALVSMDNVSACIGSGTSHSLRFAGRGWAGPPELRLSGLVFLPT
jgi:hypothetical protein